MVEAVMSKEIEITPEILADLLEYDPDTGGLIWRERDSRYASCERLLRTFNTTHAGKVAFASLNSHGYAQGAVLGRKFTAHRVAWALHHGDWPSGQIDHINGDRADNRIENLRSVSCAMNRRNAARRRDNTSGANGVYWYAPTKRWTAHITFNGKQKNLGYFKVFEDAVETRRAAEVKAGFHENHGRIAPISY